MLIPVEVFDKDASPNNYATWPKIVFQSIAGSKSMAGIAAIQREEISGNNRYRITVQIDTRAKLS